MEKRCSTCGKVKNLIYFSRTSRKYPKDGYSYQCKLCRSNAYVIWCMKNKKHKVEYNKKYILKRLATDPGYLQKLAKTRGERDIFLKRAARARLFRAVEEGKIKRLSCQYPGCGDTNSEAHHWNYSRALTVTWLCRKHHELADLVFTLLET